MMLSMMPRRAQRMSLQEQSKLCEMKDKIIGLFDKLLNKLGGEELSANITYGKVCSSATIPACATLPKYLLLTFCAHQFKIHIALLRVSWSRSRTSGRTRWARGSTANPNTVSPTTTHQRK